MAKVKISEFNSNPALNTDIDSINLAEGCAPSGINDAIRELMSQLKDWQSGTSNDPYVVGSSGSLTLNQGTANTVPYLNGSKVVTSGTALSFDGTNLGLGVTPSAWSYFKAAQVGVGCLAAPTNAANTVVYNNAYYNGSSELYITSNAASQYQQLDGAHIWKRASSGTAGNAITFTQAMTLDASGNLGIGTTSPSNRIHVQTATTGTVNAIRWTDGATDTGYLGIVSGGGANLWAGGFLAFGAGGGASYTERARIDSSGNLLVKLTSAIGSETVQTSGSGTTNKYCYFASADVSTYGGYAMRMYSSTNSSVVGSITFTTTATAYNTSSDYRLKNITGALTGYKERLMSLQPKQGTWKADGSEFRGFLAHDFAVPYRASVTGEKDAVDAEGNPIMQAMQASSSEVMADLVALVKEQQAIIESLTTRITALEGQ